MFKQLLQLDAIDVCQIDSCRLGGVNEVLAVLLMSAKYGVPVCPHAGGVGLCEYVVSLPPSLPGRRLADRICEKIHLSLIDYICVSGNMDRNVLEFVEYVVLPSFTLRIIRDENDRSHLHEHFLFPVSINAQGRYKSVIRSVPFDVPDSHRLTSIASRPTPRADIRSRCTKTRCKSSPSPVGPTGSQQHKAKSLLHTIEPPTKPYIKDPI